jgi:hypothetical protein
MGIITFRKIAWFMETDSATTIRSIFGKNKFKHINKINKIIEENPDIYTT